MIIFILPRVLPRCTRPAIHNTVLILPHTPGKPKRLAELADETDFVDNAKEQEYNQIL